MSPLQVNVKLSREGTSGDATVSWSLVGTGDQAVYVTSEDVGQMQGTVVMQSGNILVHCFALIFCLILFKRISLLFDNLFFTVLF